MNDKEVKKLNNYDIKIIISRAKKEFGFIPRGEEELYNPQLDYLEHFIYDIYKEISISDNELQEVIALIIYDVKGLIENKIYDYENIVNSNQITFAKRLQMLFNPILNKDIKINKNAKNNLKEIFILPIMCLLRIYDSIDFWRNRYGKNGYYRMLEEMVLPITYMGKQPYALEDKYILNES